LYAINLGALHFRYLDRDKTHALTISDNDYEGEISLSEESINEILWWKENIKKKNGKQIRFPKIDMYLETDASNVGWGANLKGIHTGGRWAEVESSLHINILEILAIKFALLSLCNRIENAHICIRSDNSSAVSYINNQGGSIISLSEIAKEIFLWCDKRNIVISAVHIAGKNNVTADYLSRSFSDSTEWKLNEIIFENICKALFHPDIDLFASRLNKQLDNYVSWFPDPMAITSDAFFISWTKFKPYIFPPFSLTGRILQKLVEDEVRNAILIVPKWSTQSWYPKLLERLTGNPIRLPVVPNLLRLAHNNQMHPMNKRKMFLFACPVSGLNSKTEAYQKNLSNLSPIHGDLAQIGSMTLFGINGSFGAIVVTTTRFHINSKTVLRALECFLCTYKVRKSIH
jgi:hypothetical protein